jgi:pimeloyl-ACP methyl ester carboxylesterase
VLVLCPGFNGDPDGWISASEWRDYAIRERLGLAGIAFASDPHLLADRHRGYYCASQGSGELLLKAIQKAYGGRLPILIFGFSGGAHFTSQFVEWCPDRVIAWCAYSAGWWDVPLRKSVAPPGIVACGEADERYGETLTYFLQGRAVGRRWTWVDLGNTSHGMSEALNAFVRDYFGEVIKSGESGSAAGKAKPEWRDVDTKTLLSGQAVHETPTLAAWLPSEKIAIEWSAVHQP